MIYQNLINLFITNQQGQINYISATSKLYQDDINQIIEITDKNINDEINRIKQNNLSL